MGRDLTGMISARSLQRRVFLRKASVRRKKPQSHRGDFHGGKAGCRSDADFIRRSPEDEQRQEIGMSASPTAIAGMVVCGLSLSF